TVSAEMKYEAALKYRARSTLLVWKSGVTRLTPSLTRASTLNRPAASGAVPYVVSRLSWFARSSLSLGTRLGMDAAVAGFQNWLATPARNLATKIQIRLGNRGMDRKSRPRTTSPMIITIRRSSRSATAPASGPNSSAGSSVTSHTALTAEPLAAGPPDASEGASTVSATMLSQSPRLDRDSAIHSRRNGLMERTPGSRAWLRRAAPFPSFPRPAPPLAGAARKFTA